jgi:S-adenosylmethionine-diacylglycerol 3-amino-3-carboxypropyl transferase
LQRQEAQNNLYLHHILTGEFGKQVPHYARREHFETIKQNIERIQFVQGYAEEAAGTFHAFNLSNIFEYMPREIAEATVTKLAAKSEHGARFAFWNLMVPRSLENLVPTQFRYEREQSEQFTKNDNGFFYHRFLLETRV